MNRAVAEPQAARYYSFMEPVGKMLVAAGLTLTAFGVMIWLAGKGSGGLLPGDLYVDRGGFKFYFPIVTCIVVSLVLTLLFWLFRR